MHHWHRPTPWPKPWPFWNRTFGPSTAGVTNELVMQVLVTQWVLKVGWEALLTPVTYAVVGFLKRREGFDVYDERTEFTPFGIGA